MVKFSMQGHFLDTTHHSIYKWDIFNQPTDNAKLISNYNTEMRMHPTFSKKF